VIKVGGSWADKADVLKKLCRSIVRYAQKHTIIVVPGGGPFADLVRAIYKTLRLSETTAHWMAILAMDQYGLLLQDVAKGSTITYSPIQALKMAKQGGLPILLPSKIMLTKDPLEHSWNVTSDSISAYLAGLAGAIQLILVKDVDGIYTDDPKKASNVKLIRSMSAKMLLEHQGWGCVDRHLSKILMEKRLECFVVNGRYPSRIKAILEGRKTVCTKITA